MKSKYALVFKVFLVGLIIVSSATKPAFGSEGHGLFTAILQEHVDRGKVNYKELQKDDRLTEYLDQLSKTNPDSFVGRSDQVAFWINAYNAYTLKLIVDNYPIKSINKLHSGGLILGSILKKTAWHKKFIVINKQVISLDYIEHKILRPRYKDPRIHFAIVCAAKGCPPLRSEAYEADILDQQLDDQGRVFLSTEKNNRFDLDRKVAIISPIFDWFEKDFAKSSEELLEFIAQFLPLKESELIRRGLGEWKIEYSFYDWSLNEGENK